MAYTFRNRSSFLLGDSNIQLPILPADIEGRFFGLMLLKRADATPAGAAGETYPTIDRGVIPPTSYVANSAGARVVFEMRRNGTPFFTSQVWSKKQWRPTQRFSQPPQWIAGPQNWAFTQQPPLPPWQFPSPAVASYGNAYFLPSAWPSAVPSTDVANFWQPLAVHPEPFFVTFDRKLGDTIDWNLRVFGDQPNPALGANAINDDPPPADFGVRPAEVTIPHDPVNPGEAGYRLDGFIVRIGNVDSERITAIPNDPNWGIAGT